MSLVDKYQEALSIKPPQGIRPPTHWDEATDAYRQAGVALLQEGKVAALIVAGGLGTRLKLTGSKGLYPITPVKQKTLFQLFAERVKAASLFAGRPLHLLIMTSPVNDDEVQNYFKKQHFFGLEEGQILFFCQGSLPYMTQEGQLLEAQGPDGNGVSLQQFYASPHFTSLQAKGVELITFGMVDNPLGDPYDPILVGYHYTQGNEATVKCVKRDTEEEKVGLVVETDEGVRVVEYSEVEEKKGFPLANISLFCFSFSLVEKAGKGRLPLHAHLKEVQGVGKVYKFEKFIFDNLVFAEKISCLVYPKKEVFAPLKNLEGADSPSTVQRALVEYDKGVITALTGNSCHKERLELDPKFYYPTETLKKLWWQRELPATEYITAE